MRELPSGWCDATLSQVCEFNPRHDSAEDRQQQVSFVPMAAVSDNEGVIQPHGTKLLKDVWQGYTHFREGDVIFAKITPCMENGKIAIARGLHRGIACGSTEFHVFRPSTGISASYIWHFLRQIAFRAEAARHMTGAVGQRRVPKAFLENLLIPLPPANEQRRIVGKLDSLFERTRRAREELSQIPRLIEMYKKAILQAAFRGDLTKDLRSDYHMIEGEPWSLPASWAWGRFDCIAEVASNLVAPSQVLDLPHIAPNHIVSGVPRLLRYQTVREDNVKSAKHRFFPGQVIYSKIRPYLRKAVLVNFDGVCSADMYPLNAKGEPLFLLYWLLSPGFNDLAIEHQGRVVLPKINKNALNSIATPIPPRAEQAEIARRIDLAMDWLSVVDTEQVTARHLLDRLDQANLAKAFRGELVPQDPTDEPASVLLERIRAARAEQAKDTRKGRGKVATSGSVSRADRSPGAEGPPVSGAVSPG